MIASERSEPIFSYLALETCDSSQCFVGKYFCRYNESPCWFKYVGDTMMALLMTIYTDKLETGENIDIFLKFKIITFVRTFIRYTSINYG